MTTPLLERVAARFADPVQNGTGVKVRCPSHEDRRPSLHLSIGKNGAVVLKCFAGCENKDILAAVGLTFADLFEPKAEPRREQPTYVTYDYRDEDGRLLYQAVRKQFADRKDFYQRKPKPGGGCENTLAGVRRVLYRLPELLASSPDEYVVALEGEKDVDRARDAGGVPATTNVGGVGKWRADDSAVLRDRHVVLMPDNDQAGYRHMLDVCRSLDGVAASVAVVRLTGVPAKGDLSDALDAGLPWADLDALCTGERSQVFGAERIDVYELARLAGEPPDEVPNSAYANNVRAEEDPDETDNSAYANIVREGGELPPFPVDAFPEAVQRYVTDGAEALNVPVDMIALPLLGFAAGAIGNSRELRIKASWTERPNLWLAVIGDPGSGKSPAISYARAPLDHLQRDAWNRYQDELATWETAELAAKSDRHRTDPPPERPTLQHYYTTDVTLEALASMLSTSAGVAVVRDELTGWVKSHDAYRQAGDRQSYLSLWAGLPLKTDRKGSGTTFVPRPCVPIVGGIQPDLLPDLAEAANRRDGFIERLVMVWPAAKPQRWNEATIDPTAAHEVQRIFDALRLPMVADNPATTTLDAEARQLFGQWFDENAEIRESANGVAAGFYAKYPGQLARIALVLHALWYPTEPTRPIDEATVSDAIAVVEYLRAHLRRILPVFAAVGSTKEAGLGARILRVLTNADGAWVARRELRRGLGNSASAEDIATVVDRLETEGRVETQTVPTGARPRQEVRLTPRTPRTIFANAHLPDDPTDGPPDGQTRTPPRTYEHMDNCPNDEGRAAAPQRGVSEHMNNSPGGDAGGAAPDTAPSRPCRDCGGAGQYTTTMNSEKQQRSCGACDGSGAVVARERGQLDGENAVIVQHCAVDGRLETPVRSFRVGEAEPYAQRPATVSVVFVPRRKRNKAVVTMRPDDLRYLTIESESEIEGRVLYDSRVDVPCDMAKWAETNRQFENRRGMTIRRVGAADDAGGGPGADKWTA